MASDLVSESDLKELTGRERAAAQAKWLTRKHIKFHRRADGKIRTTWTAVNSTLVSGRTPEAEPDLQGINA